jgi:predicted Rossmann-fold nucleotide-binding protein
MFARVVSGGQTGVDRAALDVAREKGLPLGGWCPKGRRAEDGVLDLRYLLIETPSEEYFQRTEWNVRDSDGTLVLTRGTPTEGTAFTIEIAKKLRKPCLVLDVAEAPSESAVKAWANENNVRVLNVAGSRESKCPGIYAQAAEFLRKVFP